jgi:hypothetical protein
MRAGRLRSRSRGHFKTDRSRRLWWWACLDADGALGNPHVASLLVGAFARSRGGETALETGRAGRRSARHLRVVAVAEVRRRIDAVPRGGAASARCSASTGSPRAVAIRACARSGATPNTFTSARSACRWGRACITFRERKLGITDVDMTTDVLSRTHYLELASARRLSKMSTALSSAGQICNTADQRNTQTHATSRCQNGQPVLCAQL